MKPTDNLTDTGLSGGIRLTALGNAGFLVTTGEYHIFFDPFIQITPGVPPLGAAAVDEKSSIVITHDHWDHFNVRAVLEAISRGAVVAGPDPVIRQLSRQAPPRALIRLEPDDVGGRVEADLPGGRVTAFRTRHGQAHNSYLLEAQGIRIFDDGDNEHTENVERNAVQNLDALLLCPWQGSRWVEFIEAVRPRRWFLMHLTDQEIEDHERGRFLPGLCARIPMDAVAPRPGRSFILPNERLP